jgi:hypothetical protein
MVLLTPQQSKAYSVALSESAISLRAERFGINLHFEAEVDPRPGASTPTFVHDIRVGAVGTNQAAALYGVQRAAQKLGYSNLAPSAVDLPFRGYQAEDCMPVAKCHRLRADALRPWATCTRAGKTSSLIDAAWKPRGGSSRRSRQRLNAGADAARRRSDCYVFRERIRLLIVVRLRPFKYSIGDGPNEVRDAEAPRLSWLRLVSCG